MPFIGMILVHEDVYKIIDILFSSTRFLKRGTVCYLVRHNGKYYIIKDHWVQNDPWLQHQNPLREVRMMKLIQGINGVPALVDFWVVENLPSVADTTQHYHEEKWWSNMKSTRTHVHLVMEPCTHLQCSKSKGACLVYMEYFM